MSKTEVRVRDAHTPYVADSREPPSTRQFGRYCLRLVTKMRYLGSCLTSTLARPETISALLYASLFFDFFFCQKEQT